MCLDGTWNSASMGKPPTNIVRIRDAVVAGYGPDNVLQRVYYDEGVGSDDADPLDRWIGGIFGHGVGRNVRQAYKYLSRHYEAGDEIYLIGFSRGAHTARSVAGMIACCGLMRPDDCTSVGEALAWGFYRTPKKDRAAGDEVVIRRKAITGVKIKCVGVFDTVGALGVPDDALNWIGRSRFSFHDTRLGTTIENAFHAVALDEHRQAFRATMWERPFNEAGDEFLNVQQVWFAGAHSDIGGGYAEDDHPELGRITLGWMTARLRQLGVAFDMARLRKRLSGLDAAAVEGEVHDSWSPMYRIADNYRRHFRPVAGKGVRGSERGTPQLMYDPIRECIHRSVLDRCLARRNYRPKSLSAVTYTIGGKELPVIDWDGKPMSMARVRQTYADVIRSLDIVHDIVPTPARQTASSSP